MRFGKGSCWILGPLLLAAALGCAPAMHDPCVPIDPVLARSSFVLVVEPRAGARVVSPLRARGCARTFESNVIWVLRGADGRALAQGHTSGGGIDSGGAFRLAAEFHLNVAELGQLEVFEEDASEGEGNPPARMVIPVVLLPSSRGSYGSEVGEDGW